MHKYVRRPSQAKAFGKYFSGTTKLLQSIHLLACRLFVLPALQLVTKTDAQNRVSIVSAVTLVVLVSRGGI